MQSTSHCTETLPLMPWVNFNHFIGLATYTVLGVAQCEHTITHNADTVPIRYNCMSMILHVKCVNQDVIVTVHEKYRMLITVEVIKIFPDVFISVRN